MKKWIALTGILSLGVLAIVVIERQKVDPAADPAAILYLIADTEHELMQMPTRFDRMPDEQEIQVGNRMAEEYRGRGESEPDPSVAAISEYLTQVGLQVSAHAHRRLPYQFHYLPEKYLINAFALPGGHVYVGQGLLALMDSEDELAAVIGHEIEHIDHYDCATRVQQQSALRKLPLAGLFALPMAVFEAGYSKDQELQADRDGTKLAVQAGYSANGTIRMFETFQRLYNDYHAKAATPQDEVSQLALDTLEGYFRSHPLPSERIAQVQQLIASENWPPHPERDLAVAYVFWTIQAQDELAAHHYPQAQQLATRSLTTRPGQPKALQVLAEAQFTQADFQGAATSYLLLLELNPPYSELAEKYAEALAAADRQSAIRGFRKWVATLNGNQLPVVEVPTAGLALIAGDSTLANESEKRANLAGDPLALGELGIWYYRAGNYAKAEALLGEANQQRPGSERFVTARAWALIENRRLADALQSLPNRYQTEGTQPGQIMARAIASWQAKDLDSAVIDFASAVAAQPEWANPRWVQPQYSAAVAHSIEEIQVEILRRQHERETHHR